MRHTPQFLITDPDEVRRLIRENPWATIVSNTASGLIASHYPVVLEADADRNGADRNGADRISIVSHVGRPDDRLHELGEHEVLVIIQGPHGYISPGWYGDQPAVPTWNHLTAHLYGRPEILSDEENWRVLGELVDQFEGRMPHPQRLADNEEYGRSIVGGTVGFRLVVTRFDARAKLSQNKSDAILDSVIDELDHGQNYSRPALAEEMRRARGGRAREGRVGEGRAGEE
ncbi:MAG: transcriptional regulator [Microbacteriaceae bacterium]|nr:transcriptional regulator [Microbacteriaceae bacterium]